MEDSTKIFSSIFMEKKELSESHISPIIFSIHIIDLQSSEYQQIDLFSILLLILFGNLRILSSGLLIKRAGETRKNFS